MEIFGGFIYRERLAFILHFLDFLTSVYVDVLMFCCLYFVSFSVSMPIILRFLTFKIDIISKLENTKFNL